MNLSLLATVKSYARTKQHLLVHAETAVVALLATATVLVMVSHLVFLTTYPVVFIDEPWYSNAAWNWLTAGVNFDTMHAGTLDQFGYEWLRWTFLSNVPLVVSFAVLGLGLFQARLVSWIFGALLLLATFLVGRRCYGRTTGIVAALLLSLSLPFLQASHYVRPDVMLAAVVMLTFLSALTALEENKKWAHLLAGLMIGLSLDVHPNGLIFALALVGVYLAAYRSRFFRQPGTWLCALGGLLGIGYYVAVHVLPNPGAFLVVRSLSFSGPHKLPLLTLTLRSLISSVDEEIGRYGFYANNLEFALVGASMAYLAFRHHRPDRLLLVFVGVAFLGFVLFAGNKDDTYAILLYPFFMLAVAETLVSLMRAGRGLDKHRAFVGGLLALTLVNSTAHCARPIAQHRGYDYYSITEKIKSVIPSGARVMGRPEWWLGLADYDYRSSLNLTYYHFLNGYTLTQGLEEIRPDIVIVDDWWRTLLVDEGYFVLGSFRVFYLQPRQEFESFLARRGEKLLDFTDPWQGRFEVYAIQWE